MNSVNKIPNPDSIEKQYPYRYAWFPTLFMVFIGGLGTFGMVSLAISKGIAWPWFFTLLFFVLFIFGAWITIVNIQGKLRFIISKEGVYIPSIWNSKAYTFVEFSKISDVEYLEVQGNIILQLSVGSKKYSITHTWFPTKNAFQEIAEIVKERLPAHLKHDTA